VHETNFSGLPPSEQAKRYRSLAAYALHESLKSTGDMRETYLLLAEEWHRLALEAELELAKEKKD